MAFAAQLLRHVRRRRFPIISISHPLQFSPVNLPLLPHRRPISSKSFPFFSSPTNSNETETLTPYSSSRIIESDLGSETLSYETAQPETSSALSWDYSIDTITGFLDRYHDLTGLPWWIIIMSSTIAMRVCILPVLVLQLKKAARIAQLRPLLPPPLPPLFKGKSFTKQYLFFRKKRKELGCPSSLWNFAFFAVQFPAFISWMSTIRTMSLNHHSGFETGGALWFENLTVPPHGAIGCIFPILISGLHYINIQLSFESVQFENTRGIMGLVVKYYKLYLDILSLPLLLIGFLIPQGSLVYWSTNSLFTLCQQLTLRNELVRKKLGLPNVKPHKKLLDDSLEIDKETIESLSLDKILDIALEEMSLLKHESALRFLRVAIEKDPDSVRALVAFGQIMHSKTSFEEAISYVERAIPKIEEDDPLLVLAHFVASVSHISLGKRDIAIKYLSRIADLPVPEKILEKSNYYTGLVLLGSSLFEVGRKSEAILYLQRAAAFDPAVNAYVRACENAMEQDKESNGGGAPDHDQNSNVEVTKQDERNTEEVIKEDKRSNG